MLKTLVTEWIYYCICFQVVVPSDYPPGILVMSLLSASYGAISFREEDGIGGRMKTTLQGLTVKYCTRCNGSTMKLLVIHHFKVTAVEWIVSLACVGPLSTHCVISQLTKVEYETNFENTPKYVFRALREWLWLITKWG